MINDQVWNKDTFLPTVGKRGAAIIEARGLSSAASAANAAIDHMRDWALGTGGEWVTMGVPSNGEYGIPKDVMFGYPVTCAGGKYKHRRRPADRRVQPGLHRQDPGRADGRAGRREAPAVTCPARTRPARQRAGLFSAFLRAPPMPCHPPARRPVRRRRSRGRHAAGVRPLRRRRGAHEEEPGAAGRAGPGVRRHAGQRGRRAGGRRGRAGASDRRAAVRPAQPPRPRRRAPAAGGAPALRRVADDRAALAARRRPT